jgi:hypothetical protein
VWISHHACDFSTLHVIWPLMRAISTRTRVIYSRRFWHIWVWLRQERVCFTYTRVEFQLNTCDFKTNQLKLSSDHQKNPDWVLNSGYTTSTSVIFTLLRVLFTLMSINLSYRHMAAVSMRAKSTLCADCNRTILRVGSTRICEDLTRMHQH